MKIYIVNSQIDYKTKELLQSHGLVAGIAAHPDLPVPEKHHADMQFSKINDNILICAPGTTFENDINLNLNIITGSNILNSKYPHNIAYNILRCDKFIIHNTKYTATEIISEAKANALCIVDCKQGYAGCSSISVPLKHNSTLLISSDKGIISSINKLNCQNIFTEFFTDTNSILLPGYDHGFIGGCCGYDKELGLLVYGKINGQLKELSAKYNFPIFSIFDGPITDIGGILVMYPNQ